MKTLRCDAVVVQIVVTEVDDQGRPIGELTTQPVKVFRAKDADVWALVETVVAAMQAQA